MEFEDVSSLQEQVKKDLRAALEVQDEKWRLEMNEEIEHNNTWVWSDLSKGSQPIDKNSVNDKSVKEKNKFANKNAKTERAENKLATGKAKYRSTTIDKVKGKSVMKKAKNLTIYERDKHNVRRVIVRWISWWIIKEQRWRIKEAFKFTGEFCWVFNKLKCIKWSKIEEGEEDRKLVQSYTFDHDF